MDIPSLLYIYQQIFCFLSSKVITNPDPRYLLNLDDWVYSLHEKPSLLQVLRHLPLHYPH